MGIVSASVTTPHGLDFNALTTMRARTEMRMIIIPSTATSAVYPPIAPISSFAICPSDLPSRRIDEERITQS